jgi:hypothetical protein
MIRICILNRYNRHLYLECLGCRLLIVAVLDRAVETLELGAFRNPAQNLSPPKLFEGREIVFFVAGRIIIESCNVYSRLDSALFKKVFYFTHT